MSEKIEKIASKKMARWLLELNELEPDCSTGKLSMPEEQKQKIDALLDRARLRK